jgi:hypothetical protein
VLRRSLVRAARRRPRPGILARQIGGVRTLRDFPGSGRDPLLPVPRGASARRSTCWPRRARRPTASWCRRAATPPCARLRGRTDAVFEGDGRWPPTSPLHDVLDMQRALLNQLMSNSVAVRILDGEPKAANRADAFGCPISTGAEREIWSELEGKAISRRCGASCSAST